MKVCIPETIPSRSEFLTKLLDAIFPDLEEKNFARTGYGYTAACDYACKELGLSKGDLDEDDLLVEDSKIFRLMYELNASYETIFNKKAAILFSTAEKYYLKTSISLTSGEKNCRAYECYSKSLYTFCDQTSGSIKGWLKPASESSRLNKSFEIATFFTYLLLMRPECKETRRAFLDYCFSVMGATDFEESVKFELYNFNWEDIHQTGTIDGRTFNRLTNRPIIVLGTIVLTILELLGNYAPEKDADRIEAFYSLLKELFKEEFTTARATVAAERALFNSLRFFEPRSIQTAKKLYPQDFFVMPVFTNENTEVANPLSEITNASKSKRLLIMAKTGLGKSAYLQMATLCMLEEKFASDVEDGLKQFAKKLNVPHDTYVLSIPAKMFSFCFRDERYRDWTNDFIALYFNFMWKIVSGYNCFSTQTSQRITGLFEKTQNEDFEVTEALYNYIQELARRGKLILLLDSFDEISSGNMRNAYLKSVAAFYDQYCCYPEANDTGAHVIISSREMSPKTMKNLEHALEIGHEREIYGISLLNREQREELISKWNRFANIPENESKTIMNQIEENHYYLDYSVNPYMLSVVCFYFGHDLGSITQRYISFLVDRMMKNNRTADPVIQDVLMNISKILQDIAGETITEGSAHFSRQKLDRYLSRFIDKGELTEEEFENYIERLHETFITEVGLIVPADGNDLDYQFINNQIRYELAAKGIQRVLTDDEKTSVYRELIFPSITNVEEYVGLLVPLLCDINLENVKLAEQLVSDLAMYDFKNEKENQVLTTTMMDLLLNRYGGSIITASNPGIKDRMYVRRAQRILLMRLFSSSAFRPSQIEKISILSSPAYTANINWVAEPLRNELA